MVITFRSLSDMQDAACILILAFGVMLIHVRSNDQIEGIKINDFEVKLSAYADDTYFFALDIWSLLVVLDRCRTFQEFCSLKLERRSASETAIKFALLSF